MNPRSKDVLKPAILLSIRPEYYDRIRSGEKTVELRRRFPNILAGTLALLYVSAPLSAVVGMMVVESTLRSSPESLWEQVHDRAGVSKEEFERYYDGAVEANGLIIDDLRQIRPISLGELRRLWPSFSPPQSFRYVMVKVGSERLLVALPHGDEWIEVAGIDDQVVMA